MTPVTAADRYLDHVGALLRDVRETEHDAIEQAAWLAADSVADGGVIHVFGAGHSQLVALDGLVRAGGLACVNVLHDPALSPSRPGPASRTERLPGYAAVIVDSADVRAGEVVVVVSNSGVNAVPVELARRCADRGLHVVAVTSRQHTEAVPPRDPSGARLADLATVVIDTHGPLGDAAVELAGGARVGGVSTVLAVAILTALLARTAELLEAAGHAAPVIESQNVPGRGAENAALVARYRDRTGAR